MTRTVVTCAQNGFVMNVVNTLNLVFVCTHDMNQSKGMTGKMQIQVLYKGNTIQIDTEDDGPGANINILDERQNLLTNVYFDRNSKEKLDTLLAGVEAFTKQTISMVISERGVR